MPLSSDMIVKAQTGSATAGAAGNTTFTVDLGLDGGGSPWQTSAGNRLILAASTTGLNTGYIDNQGTWKPFAFTSLVAGARAYELYRPAVAGETSWTITITSSSANGPVAWILLEVQGLDPVYTADVTGIGGTGSLAATTGSTSTAAYDEVGLCLHAAAIGGTTPVDLGSQTGGYSEVYQSTATDGTTSVTAALSVKYLQQLGTQASTATATGGTPTSAAWALGTLVGSGAKWVADVRWCDGFAWGPIASATWVVPGGGMVDAVVGSPSVVAAADTVSGYALQCSATSGTCQVQLSNRWNSGTSDYWLVVQMRVKLSSLPSTDVEILSLVTGNVNMGNATLRYRTASQKLGMQLTNGTEVLSDAAVTAGVWMRITVRFDGSSTAYTTDWQIDYDDTDTTGPVAQTAATATESLAATGGVSIVRLGWGTAASATVLYTDFTVALKPQYYPMPVTRVYPLPVDTGGSITVVGTIGNFALVTSNATGATLVSGNLATALANVGQAAPPTVGSTQSGVCQITAATGDYLRIPLQTVNMTAVGGVPRGVWVLAQGWAASATAAYVKVRTYDGTTEYTRPHEATSDSGFDNSTTVPVWAVSMVRSGTGAGVSPLWTQAMIDALEFRVGYSGDATPDVGVLWLMAQVAVVKTQTAPMFGALASAAADPDSAGVQTISATAPAGGDATLHYETSGTPTDATVPAGTTVTVAPQAPDAPTTNYVAFYPPPEGVADA